MKPRPFDYVRPDTVDEAVAVLAEHGDDARILAGGQSLLAMLNLRLADPAVLIDITRIAALDEIRDLGGKIEIGAAVTQNRLLAWPDLAKKLPLLAAALPFVGHFQTRNKGTVCGSVAHADPSSEIPLSLAVLEGEVVLRSHRGERVLAAKEFQQDMLTTAREPDELIIAVRFPVASKNGVAFREVARRHGDFAIIAVAAIAEKSGAITTRRRRYVRPAGGAPNRGWRVCDRRMPSINWRRNSKATRICTPPRPCGATSCAGSGRSSSTRRSDAPHKQGSARPHQAHPQWPRAVGGSRAAHVAERFHPPFAGRDRHACRL